MDLLLIFIIGITASFFGSFMSGGTSLIGFTALYAIGLPPHIVLSTFRIGMFGFESGGFWQYFKARKVDWSLFWPLTIASVVGAVIGANIVLAIDATIIEKIVGYTILFFIPIVILKPKLGIENHVVSTRKRWAGHFVSVLFSVWGSSFTIGVGYFYVFKAMYFYGLTLLQAKASGKLPGVISNIAVLIIFVYGGIVDWSYGLMLFMGMLIGSSLGTRYAIKLGDSWLRYILLATIALFSLKLILGL